MPWGKGLGLVVCDPRGRPRTVSGCAGREFFLAIGTPQAAFGGVEGPASRESKLTCTLGETVVEEEPQAAGGFRDIDAIHSIQS